VNVALPTDIYLHCLFLITPFSAGFEANRCRIRSIVPVEPLIFEQRQPVNRSW